MCRVVTRRPITARTDTGESKLQSAEVSSPLADNADLATSR
jgi:hypothetical protein